MSRIWSSTTAFSSTDMSIRSSVVFSSRCHRETFVGTSGAFSSKLCIVLRTSCGRLRQRAGRSLRSKIQVVFKVRRWKGLSSFLDQLMRVRSFCTASSLPFVKHTKECNIKTKACTSNTSTSFRLVFRYSCPNSKALSSFTIAAPSKATARRVSLKSNFAKLLMATANVSCENRLFSAHLRDILASRRRDLPCRLSTRAIALTKFESSNAFMCQTTFGNMMETRFQKAG
mmetsp:Transcript_49309/g.106129  ORF Transcript_49309/g.106129 Transcript_49309/m.106129 type:complete len:229 (-) Transcript_49309:364-1050(-)